MGAREMIVGDAWQTSLVMVTFPPSRCQTEGGRPNRADRPITRAIGSASAPYPARHRGKARISSEEERAVRPRLLLYQQSGSNIANIQDNVKYYLQNSMCT